jgi:hypothetical protein
MANKKDDDTALPLSEKARVTAAGEEGMAVKRETPADLDDYSGKYVETDSGEEFGLKKVPDDPKGHTHHLKNKVHFHALTEADFKRLFEKK